MPTIIIEGYRFGFWSADCAEPPHVHVTRDGKRAKIWLLPISVASFRGYNERELNQVLKLVRAHQARLLEMWHEHCDQI